MIRGSQCQKSFYFIRTKIYTVNCYRSCLWLDERCDFTVFRFVLHSANLSMYEIKIFAWTIFIHSIWSIKKLTHLPHSFVFSVDALQLVSKSFVRIFHGITFIRKFHHRIKTLRHIYTKSICEIGNRSTSGGSTLYLTLSVIPWTATSTGPAAIITNVIFQFSTKLTRNPDNILDKLWIM